MQDGLAASADESPTGTRADTWTTDGDPMRRLRVDHVGLDQPSNNVAVYNLGLTPVRLLRAMTRPARNPPIYDSL